MTLWSVYIIRCCDNSLYTGIATDVVRRLCEHQAGRIGSKYLRGRGPFELALELQVGDRSLTSKIEYRLKQLSHDEKERVLQMPERITAMILDICPSWENEADDSPDRSVKNDRSAQG